MREPKEIFFEMAEGIQSATRWIDIIRQAQQEAYEEGRRDGYASCKSDYATQITYNK